MQVQSIARTLEFALFLNILKFLRETTLMINVRTTCKNSNRRKALEKDTSVVGILYLWVVAKERKALSLARARDDI